MRFIILLSLTAVTLAQTKIKEDGTPYFFEDDEADAEREMKIVEQLIWTNLIHKGDSEFVKETKALIAKLMVATAVETLTNQTEASTTQTPNQPPLLRFLTKTNKRQNDIDADEDEEDDLDDPEPPSSNNRRPDVGDRRRRRPRPTDAPVDDSTLASNVSQASNEDAETTIVSARTEETSVSPPEARDGTNSSSELGGNSTSSADLVKSNSTEASAVTQAAAVTEATAITTAATEVSTQRYRPTPEHIYNQVGKILSNVGSGNITGIVDQSLSIRAPAPVRLFVTGLMNLIFCNPVNRIWGACAPQ